MYASGFTEQALQRMVNSRGRPEVQRLLGVSPAPIKCILERKNCPYSKIMKVQAGLIKAGFMSEQEQLIDHEQTWTWYLHHQLKIDPYLKYNGTQLLDFIIFMDPILENWYVTDNDHGYKYLMNTEHGDSPWVLHIYSDSWSE